jgi:hypothetical protein
MRSISQQTKDVLVVASTIGIGIGTGFFVDAWSKRESFAASLSALVVLGLSQLLLIFVPSKDMLDLEEYRKGDMADLKIKNTMAEKAQKLAEEGKLSEALEWRHASRKLGQGRKPQ